MVTRPGVRPSRAALAATRAVISRRAVSEHRTGYSVRKTRGAGEADGQNRVVANARRSLRLCNTAEHGPDPIDVHVGSRARRRRIQSGMDQTHLGEAHGVTVQQVQNHESRANRIGASRCICIPDLPWKRPETRHLYNTYLPPAVSFVSLTGRRLRTIR